MKQKHNLNTTSTKSHAILHFSLLYKKNVSTINDSVYYGSDKQVYTISYSNKQVDPSINPKEETHIIDIIRKLSIRPILFEPAAIGFIGKDLVTSV